MKGQQYLKNVATLELDVDKCTGCRLCAIVCPHRVFDLEAGKAVVEDADLCMECGACSLNCSANAIKVRSGVGCANAVLHSMWKSKSASSCG